MSHIRQRLLDIEQQTWIKDKGFILEGQFAGAKQLHSFFFIRILFFLCTDAQPPKNCVIFIGCNFKSRARQVGLHKQKEDTA